MSMSRDFRSKRSFIIGNPLIAMTMLKHEVTAGLNVPVDVTGSEA